MIVIFLKRFVTFLLLRLNTVFANNWTTLGLFFLYFHLNSKFVKFKFYAMTEFEPWTSYIGRDRSANCMLKIKTGLPNVCDIQFFRAHDHGIKSRANKIKELWKFT